MKKIKAVASSEKVHDIRTFLAEKDIAVVECVSELVADEPSNFAVVKVHGKLSVE